jgi:hypothetical protein
MHTYKELAEYCASIYGNRKLLIVPYAYNLTFSGLGLGVSNQSLTQQLSITANADFVFTECFHSAAVDTNNSEDVNTEESVAAKILITDSGSGEQFMNAPTMLENYSSVLNFRRPLAFPRFIQGRTALAVTLSVPSDVAASYQFVNVSLRGVLVRAFTEI